MNKLTVEIRDWRRQQIERYGKDIFSPTSWLLDYLNNFHSNIFEAFNPERTWAFKTRTLDVKLRDQIQAMPEEPGWAQNMSELRKDKTAREFYADVKGAVEYFGFGTNGLIGPLSGTPAEKRRDVAHRMKVFLRLREIGYNRLDLIG